MKKLMIILVLALAIGLFLIITPVATAQSVLNCTNVRCADLGGKGWKDKTLQCEANCTAEGLGIIEYAQCFWICQAKYDVLSNWWVEYGEGGGGREVAPSDFPQLPEPPWGNPNTLVGEGTPSPHGGFSSTSNLCKTCHAVHLAESDSYRLLLASSRMDECDACHDAETGRSSHRPYGEMFLQGLTVRGEHTLGATVIPDSRVNVCRYVLGSCPGGAGCIPTCPTGGCDPAEKCYAGEDKGRYPNRSVGDRTEPGKGLYCFDCHSVHGANVIPETIDEHWNEAIVRDDPAADGDLASINPDQYTDGDGILDEEEKEFGVQSAFCSDCHTENMNWDTNSADDLTGAPRPNPRSHPQGPATRDSQMEVYHQPTQVSFRQPDEGCPDCHYYGQTLEAPIASRGDWPHQTQGNKLLRSRAEQDSGWPGGPHEADAFGETVGDPQRPLEQFDSNCMGCHQWASGTQGVGKTF